MVSYLPLGDLHLLYWIFRVNRCRDRIPLIGIIHCGSVSHYILGT